MGLIDKKLKKGSRITIRFLLDFYDATLREETHGKVASTLEISKDTLSIHFRNHPELMEIKELAETRRQKTNTFKGYVYGRLSPEARELWDKITFWQQHNTADERINKVLSGRPTELKQELFLHSLVKSNFDLSSALHSVGMTFSELNHWRQSDLGFRQMVEEIQWHKKNFFERALVDLVEQGNPGAVIFVNRTINADRGYTEKIQVEHSGQVGTGINIEELDLDLDTRRKILEAIRRQKTLKPVHDVEAEIIPNGHNTALTRFQSQGDAKES